MPEPQRPTYLRKLRIKRVDVVKRGANPGARILIHKSADSDCPTCGDGVGKALANLKPSPGKKCPTCGRVMPTAKTTSKGASEMPETDLNELQKAIDAAVAAAVEPLEKQLAEAKAENERLAKGEAENEIEKAEELPEAVRKRLDDAEAAAAAAQERIAKMEDDADTARWQGVAKGLALVAVAKETGGDGVADLAGLLKDVNKGAGAAAADYLATLLSAQQKRIEESKLLAEAGATGETAGDAETGLEKAARELMKADSSLTFPMAIAKAADDNPALAADVQKEMWNA